MQFCPQTRISRFAFDLITCLPRAAGPSLRRIGPLFLGTLLLAGGLLACQTEADADEESGADAPHVVEMTTSDYAFQMPDSIPSGWTTFQVKNQGEEHHLFTFLRLPEGVTYEDFQQEVITTYDSVWAKVVEGEIGRSEAHKRLQPLLPDWYPSDLVQPGGVSLTAPGRTAETTMRMEPGTYVLECYAKTAERQYHALLGMVRPLTVYKSSPEGRAPEADQELTVSNLDIEGVGPVPAGKRTFAVRFEKDPEQLPYQHLHLARLGEEATAEEVAQWMKIDPIMPAPTEFLGGAQHMPAGNTSYVTAELTPGQYGWVLGAPPKLSEVETFTVE